MASPTPIQPGQLVAIRQLLKGFSDDGMDAVVDYWYARRGAPATTHPQLHQLTSAEADEFLTWQRSAKRGALAPVK